MFYVAAIVTAVVTLLMLGIRESRPSQLLVREVKRLQEETGIDTLTALNPDHSPDMHSLVRVSLIRPLHLFFTEPIVFLVAIMSAVAFGLIYLFTEALPLVYESMGFSEKNSYLPFIAIVIGLLLGVLTRIYDDRLVARYKKEEKPLEPEDKLLGFSFGAPALAAGLWLFAWTIPPLVPDAPWALSMVGLVLIGYAANEFDAVLAGYLADSYLSYAASGFAALSMVRSLLSAVFPLFATQMFDGLGSNVAASILAAIATIFCAVPPIFTRYGKRIRSRSQFAQHTLKVYEQNGVDLDGY